MKNNTQWTLSIDAEADREETRAVKVIKTNPKHFYTYARENNGAI